MSTEQDKDSFSLRRNRGGDGGLDGLAGHGSVLGSPDKKKRKSNSQALSFVPLSEYAPPPNPSSDHLVASNPFDDNYSSPLASPNNVNPYFGSSHYTGFRGYGPPRMVPHMQNRMPAPFGSPFQIRNQPHAYFQTPMGFSRALGFSYMHPESPGYANQPMFNNNGSIQQHFRPGEGIIQIALSNPNHAPDAMFGPEVTMIGNHPALAVNSGPVTSPEPNFAQHLTPKLESDEIINKAAPPSRKPKKNVDECGAQESQAKGKKKPNVEGGVEKINGVLRPNTELSNKSPEPVSENSGGRKRRSTNSKPGKKKRTSGPAPSEPMYPCGICMGEVNDDQEAILCEASCQKWFHRLCTGMTEMAYNLLMAETAAVWGCDSCMDQKDGAQLLKTWVASSSATANAEEQT